MFIDFKDRGNERERKRTNNVRQKHQSVASHSSPDQGLNPQPFGVRDNAPSN